MRHRDSKVLTRGYFRLPRRLHERGVSFYATGGRWFSVVALFCILMMVAMMWMMMGEMSAFRGGPTDSRDTKRDVPEHHGKA